MEDQDPPIDAHLRGKALQQALYLYAGSLFRYAKPEVVIDTATKFYDFLKGESK